MTNYFKITIRHLKRNPVSGLIIIGGFAVSLTVSLLLSSYLFYESGYDKFFPDLDRIYRLCVEKEITTFRGDKIEELRNRYPELKMLCRYDNGTSEVIQDKSPYMVPNLVKTDNDFFRIFSLNIRNGNKEAPLPDNNSIAISSSLARTIFGNSDPIGMVLSIQHRKNFVISAVYDDLPANSSIQAHAIIAWENVYDLGGEYRNGFYYSRLFLVPEKASDPSRLEEMLTQDYSGDHYMNQPFRFLPFRKSYFSPLTDNNTSATQHASIKSIFLFSGVTFLVLLISVLNFIILITSSHLGRIKEIGIKKVTGAGRKEIFKQFIFEAVIISLIAFILSIYLSLLFESQFNSLLRKDFPALAALQFPGILIVISGVLLIAFLAGFYPAFIVSGYKPASLFGSYGITGKLQMKTGLTVVQYSISLVMIVSLLVMTRQNNYLINKDLGFTKEQLVNIRTPWEIKDKLPVIKEKLLSSPYIKSCAVSHGIPGQVALWNMWNQSNEEYGYKDRLPYFSVDPDFFKVYDAEFLQGRDFKESDWEKSVIMNETAFRLTGWESVEGKTLNGIPRPDQAFGRASADEIKKNSLNVVGVIKDINVEKLNRPVLPTVFECSDHFGINFLSCRLMPGDYPGTIAYIKKVWEEVYPGYVLDYNFYNEILDTLYKSEMHTAFTIRVFAILSLFLLCLGTFGIIHFTAIQRTKEIGVRKVHGAKIIDIIQILNWSIFKWIMIAYCIAVPISYIIMKKYLYGFAYKTSLSWWIFVLSGVLVFGIAFITTSWQSWRAANRNPVDALRYE